MRSVLAGLAMVISMYSVAQKDFSPSVSPDGKRIAFYSYIDNVPQIFIINLDGSHKEQITKSNLWSIGPVWSAKGDQIYFSQGEGMGTMDVASINLQTREIVRTQKEGMQFGLGESGSSILWASRSDGFKFYTSSDINLGNQREIVTEFQQYWVAKSDNYTIISVSDEGKEGIYLKTGNSFKQLYKIGGVKNLSISKDEKNIVFESAATGSSDIYMASIDGRQLRNLTRSEFTDYMPSLSPGSDFIIFSSNRAEGFQLHKLNLENNSIELISY
ncbi:TolB family protein [Roseivirga sp.]|uniref:TolB family protein n=1 Tax=Roseivirga sp. TaxID=1964215 RepID=UPI003B52648F